MHYGAPIFVAAEDIRNDLAECVGIQSFVDTGYRLVNVFLLR
jgi:hypothetical protein